MRSSVDRVGLRTGFTTGACAAAAAKAAAIALLTHQEVKEVTISLPGGTATLAVSRCALADGTVSCSVIKDGGDDPDVTDGAEICASVSWRPGRGIELRGGIGVGVVTKPGLEVAVGMPAINPVPHKMILDSVREVVGGRGAEVIISVPSGEALARRTLNPRLGIVGGISILGTTGIVIPYSINAYTACISQSIDVARAAGCKEVVLTTGRRSEKYAQAALRLPEEAFIQAGDFIGHALKACARKGIPRATVWSMVGKMSKLAAGHLYTNISDSSVDIAFVLEVARRAGVPDMPKLREAVTANHLRKMLPPDYLGAFCDRLCQIAAEKCKEAAGGGVEVICIVTDPEGVVLGRSDASG